MPELSIIIIHSVPYVFVHILYIFCLQIFNAPHHVIPCWKGNFVLFFSCYAHSVTILSTKKLPNFWCNSLKIERDNIDLYISIESMGTGSLSNLSCYTSLKGNFVYALFSCYTHSVIILCTKKLLTFVKYLPYHRLSEYPERYFVS